MKLQLGLITLKTVTMQSFVPRYLNQRVINWGTFLYGSESSYAIYVWKWNQLSHLRLKGKHACCDSAVLQCLLLLVLSQIWCQSSLSRRVWLFSQTLIAATVTMLQSIYIYIYIYIYICQSSENSSIQKPVTNMTSHHCLWTIMCLRSAM